MNREAIQQLADALAIAAFDNGRELFQHGNRVVVARQALIDAASTADTAEAQWLHAARELQGHLSDVLPDDVFARIDVKTWNGLSSLIGVADLRDRARAPDDPSSKQSDELDERAVDAMIAAEVTDDGKPLNPFFKPGAVRIAREHGMDLGDNPVAYEFYNPATGHAIVDYTRHTHVGHLTEEDGYEARPLIYAKESA